MQIKILIGTAGMQPPNSRVQNWGPVRDSGARSIEGVFL